MGTAREKKLEQRVLVRKERVGVLNRETFLSESYCSICPMNRQYNEDSHITRCAGCPVYAELGGIGGSLLELSNRYYTIPEELTWTAYNELKDKKEWSNKAIAKHYGTGLLNLNEFIKRNRKLMPDEVYHEEETEMNEGLTLQKMPETPQEDILTLELYFNLQAAGKTDTEIIKELGIKVHTMNKFKKENELVRKPKKGKRKSKRSRQKAANPVKEAPVVELPKDEPIQIHKHHDYDNLAKIRARDIDESVVAHHTAYGACNLGNIDPNIDITGVWGGSPDLTGEGISFTKKEPEPLKVFIIMDTTHEVGENSIKAVRGSKTAAYMFIAQYVLDEDVNTSYLELIEREVSFDEGEKY